MISVGGDRPPRVEVPQSEVRKALNIWVGARVQKILPALIVIYLTLSAGYIVLKPAYRTGIIAWSAYAIGAASLAAWMLLRRKRVAPNRIHLLALVIGGLILTHSLAKLYLTSDTSQVTVIMLLVIGSAGTLLSWAGFLAAAGLSLAGWGAIGLQKLPLSSLIFGSLCLTATAVVSGFAAWARLRKHQQGQEARILDERRKLEVQQTRQRFELAVEGTHDGLWYWDLKSNIFHSSKSWEDILGCQAGELEATPEEWFSRVHPGYLADLKSHLAEHLEGRSPQFQHEHRLCRKDGTYIWVLARGTVVRDAAGEPVGLAGSHADITSLIDVEKRMLNDSFYDKLTNLPNRHFFMGRLEKAIERRRTQRSAPLFAVMFLDLNRFKVINDSLGHLVGDQLLSAVASRLRNCARPDDVVARFGGDEFVVLLDEVRDEGEALSAAARIQTALSMPFQIGGREVVSGASIGIVLGNGGTERTEDLLRNADTAMYHAKSKRNGRVQIFNEDMHVQATKLCDLQTDLRTALERNQLLLHYQPSVSVRSGKILGVEALIRWQRSESELIAPADFIPLAEEIGLIDEIGEWVLRAACEQNSAWQRAGNPPIRMAVNVSARQLQKNDFAQMVHRILEETKLQSNWLELELTETALMDNLDVAPATLEKLNALGIAISIDDFGTGYSSLNYLRRFKFQTLKMDRCFVSDVATDKRAAAVAKGLISLAHGLDLSVTAEGVEHNSQLAFLAAENCDQIQGFLACRPALAGHLDAQLRAGSTQPGFAPGAFDPAQELCHLADYCEEGLIVLGDRPKPRKNLYLPQDSFRTLAAPPLAET